MAASVRISLKAAKDLFELLRGKEIIGTRECAAVTQLAAACARASRASTARRTLAKPKVAKRAAKKEARQEVRAAVMGRADGACESCGAMRGALTLDHQWGRARDESVASCRALCLFCHGRKTDSVPTAAYWLIDFYNHAAKYGYRDEVAKAQKRLAFVEARGTP